MNPVKGILNLEHTLNKAVNRLLMVVQLPVQETAGSQNRNWCKLYTLLVKTTLTFKATPTIQGN